MSPSLLLVGPPLIAGLGVAVAVYRVRRRSRVAPGAVARIVPPAAPHVDGPAAFPAPGAERCEVAVARRRNRAWFYARRPGSDTPIVASPEFAVRRRDGLELTPETVAALEALTEGLARLGWRFSGQEPVWFRREFVRPLHRGVMLRDGGARVRRGQRGRAR